MYTVAEVVHLVFDAFQALSQDEADVGFVVWHFRGHALAVDEVSAGGFGEGTEPEIATGSGHGAHLGIRSAWFSEGGAFEIGSSNSRFVDGTNWRLKEASFLLILIIEYSRRWLLVILLSFLIVDDIDLLIRSLLVDIVYMPLSLIQQDLSNIVLVSLFRRFLYLHGYLWVFREDLSQQKLLFKLHGHYVFNRHIYELAFFVKADIVVADVRILLELNGNPKLILAEALRHQVISNTNYAFLDEIHMCNLIFFV